MEPTLLGNTLTTKFPTVSSSVTGSFGELLQGELPGNQEFLVTCPIAHSSTTYFYQNSNIYTLEIYPPCKTKTKRAVEIYLNNLKQSACGMLVINSQIESGKGLASSTADIVSALKTMAQAIGRTIMPDEVEDILRHIEPSDGVMYDTPVVFQHRKVKLLKQLPQLPVGIIFAVDEGGRLDTVTYNRHYSNYSLEEQKNFSHLLDHLENAIHSRDLVGIGRIASESTRLHQQRAPKQHLEWLAALQHDIGAPGIINSHSGTMLGVLLDIHDNDFPNQLRYLAEKTTANGLSHCTFSLAH